MLANKELVEDQPERVDIGPLRQRRPGRPLLRRHVARRAGRHVQSGVGPQNRDAEVGDAHAAGFVDQDVGRLEIAVQHALRMRGREAAAQLARDVGDAVRR